MIFSDFGKNVGSGSKDQIAVVVVCRVRNIQRRRYQVVGLLAAHTGQGRSNKSHLFQGSHHDHWSIFTAHYGV